MKAIMLKEFALQIQTESKFEEEWLEKIIEALKIQAYAIHTATTKDNKGILTIQPNRPTKQLGG